MATINQPELDKPDTKWMVYDVDTTKDFPANPMMKSGDVILTPHGVEYIKSCYAPSLEDQGEKAVLRTYTRGKHLGEFDSSINPETIVECIRFEGELIPQLFEVDQEGLKYAQLEAKLKIRGI